MSEAVTGAKSQPCPRSALLDDLGHGFADEEHFTKVQVRFEGNSQAYGIVCNGSNADVRLGCPQWVENGHPMGS